MEVEYTLLHILNGQYKITRLRINYRFFAFFRYLYSGVYQLEESCREQNDAFDNSEATDAVAY